MTEGGNECSQMQQHERILAMAEWAEKLPAYAVICSANMGMRSIQCWLSERLRCKMHHQSEP